MTVWSNPQHENIIPQLIDPQSYHSSHMNSAKNFQIQTAKVNEWSLFAKNIGKGLPECQVKVSLKRMDFAK